MDEYTELLKEINKAADGVTQIFTHLTDLEEMIARKEQYYKKEGYLSTTEAKLRDYEITLTREIPPTLRGLKAHFEGLRNNLNEINNLIKKRGKQEKEIIQ